MFGSQRVHRSQHRRCNVVPPSRPCTTTSHETPHDKQGVICQCFQAKKAPSTDQEVVSGQTREHPCCLKNKISGAQPQEVCCEPWRWSCAAYMCHGHGTHHNSFQTHENKILKKKKEKKRHCLTAGKAVVAQSGRGTSPVLPVSVPQGSQKTFTSGSRVTDFVKHVGIKGHPKRERDKGWGKDCTQGGGVSSDPDPKPHSVGRQVCRGGWGSISFVFRCMFYFTASF